MKNRLTRLAVLSALLAFAATAFGQATTQPAPRPAAPANCIVGVWGVPIRDMAAWKARGCNALVAYEPQNDAVGKPTVTLEQWTAAAKALGLKYVRQPSADPAADARDPDLLAFFLDDEPDLNRWNASKAADDPANAALIPAGPFKGWKRPEPYAARYAELKRLAPSVPVFLNFAGPTITSDAYKGEGHVTYLAAADWIAHDWYPKNKNADRYPVSHVGKAIDRLAAWSSTGPTATPPAVTAATFVGKPQLVFIECSDQDISTLGRAPTPDEMEAEVALAIGKGARGIVYFPQHPPPGFRYDATPPELVARMTGINAWLNPPPVIVPPLDPVVAALREDLASTRADLDVANARINTLVRALRAVGQTLDGPEPAPATRPAK